MPAEARSSFQFDADTSAMNAKLEASKEAADSIGQAFVKGAIGLVKVTTAAGALLTVTGAIKDAWMEILQTQEEAARRTIAATPGRAALLARATSPEDRDRLNAAVNATRSETGVDEATATSFQMEIEKGGNQDVRAQIAQFKFLGADITGVADAIGNVRDKFHLTADEMPKLIDKMVVAAKNSEGTVQDFAQTIAQVGEASKGSGTSLDETAAILSNVGGKDVEGFKKGINALATGAINTGYDKKGGILGFVDNLASSGKSEKQLLAATGGVQGYDAYKQIIANRAGIDQSKRDLAGAGGATTSAVAAVGNDQLTGSAQGLPTLVVDLALRAVLFFGDALVLFRGAQALGRSSQLVIAHCCHR